MTNSLKHERVEPRWPVALGILILLLLVKLVPDHIQILPNWGPFVLVAPALLAMAVARLSADQDRFLRVERVILLAFAVILLGLTASSVVVLVRHILGGGAALGGLQLLASSVVAWFCNVFGFALVYWQLDGGGPSARRRRISERPDWLFPTAPTDGPDDWRPLFVDYLFLAFSTATAFSTTDTVPLTARAKLLMMLEAIKSLAIMVVVASRAVNVLAT